MIFSHFDELTIPTEINPLTPSTFLSCGVESTSAEYATRWITPSGDIITPADTGRLSIIEGNNIEIDRRIFDGTALIVLNLSYQDEGVYTCEARDLSEQDSRWRQATYRLNLLRKNNTVV